MTTPSSPKILQMLSANSGWFAVFENDGDSFRCPVSVWVLVDDGDGTTRISSYSAGDDFTELDSDAADFMAYEYIDSNKKATGE